jgi:hypothetical protein
MLRPSFMTAGNVARKVFEWVFRPAALRAARAGLATGDPGRDAALRQAKLLVEVARRVEEPADALPPGAQPAVSLALYRDAIYWALAARRPDDGAPPPDLRALWDASPAEALAAGTPDAQAQGALRRTLVDGYDPRSLAVKPADTARARAFAEALLWQSGAPRRRVNLVHAQRWLRTAGVVVLVALLVAGVRLLVRPPDLAAGKPFRISQPWSGWAECVRNEDCGSLMFVTEAGYEPWVEIDLGAPKTVQRVDVANRSKCCQDRAVPLVIELSTDQKTWSQVARKDEEFNSWTAKFRPKVARFVRLKVLRNSYLHLKSVAVR